MHHGLIIYVSQPWVSCVYQLRLQITPGGKKRKFVLLKLNMDYNKKYNIYNRNSTLMHFSLQSLLVAVALLSEQKAEKCVLAVPVCLPFIKKSYIYLFTVCSFFVIWIIFIVGLSERLKKLFLLLSKLSLFFIQPRRAPSFAPCDAWRINGSHFKSKILSSNQENKPENKPVVRAVINWEIVYSNLAKKKNHI